MIWWRLIWAAATLLFACLASCASTERVPRVSVRPNGSGIVMASIQAHGPTWTELSANYKGNPESPPDLPTKTVVTLGKLESFHNEVPRYFIGAQSRIEVISMVNHKKIWRVNQAYGTWRDLIELPQWNQEEVRSLLYKRQSSEIPWVNAGRCFHAKVRRVNFSWGEGIVFLTSYVNGITDGPVNNDMLVLVVQGFTRDGRYAVSAHLEIRHSKLPNSLWDTRRSGRAIFSIVDESKEAEQWLDEQADGSFTPGLEKYLEFLNALEITPGRRVGRNVGVKRVENPISME